MPHLPLINENDGETVLEWWNGDRKLTLYVSFNPPDKSGVRTPLIEFYRDGPCPGDVADGVVGEDVSAAEIWQWLTATR